MNVDQKLINALREKDKNNHIRGRGRLGKTASGHGSGGGGGGEWGQSGEVVVRKKGMSWQQFLRGSFSSESHCDSRTDLSEKGAFWTLWA